MDTPIAQHINSSGKQSAVKYGSDSSWVWLMTELKVPEMLPEEEIRETSMDSVVRFCDENRMIVNSKAVENGQVKGVWVQNDNVFGFIPIKVSDKPLPNRISLAIATPENPFIQTSDSVMRQYHLEQKVAEILKSISLEFYGKIIRNRKGELKDMIKVDNSVFYRGDVLKNIEEIKFTEGDKMFVPSQEAKERIIRYAEATYYSTPNKVIIPSSSFQFFQSIEDFKKRPGQLVFMSQDSLRSYFMEKKEERNVIHSNLSKIYEEDSKDPFVVKTPRFNNRRPFIVQKVWKDLRETCENVARKWADSKINEGFDYAPLEPLGNYNCIVYDTRGRVVEGAKTQGRRINLLKFGDNKYAVMFYL